MFFSAPTRLLKFLKPAPLLLALALAVTGCAVKSFNSKLIENSQVPIKVLDVYWNPEIPKTFRITKSAQGYQPVINAADRLAGENAIREMHAVFQRGFQTQFKQAALAKGISEVSLVMVPQAQLPNPTPGRHQLFVGITNLGVFCTAGCTANFDLNGMLRSPGSSAATWTFDTQVGQPTVYAKIDAAIFEAFTSTVLSDWDAKKLLAK
jgi:hypothetical protein